MKIKIREEKKRKKMCNNVKNKTSQEYPTDPLLKLSAPQARI